MRHGSTFLAIVTSSFNLFQKINLKTTNIRPISQKLNFSSGEPNHNDVSSMFELICIRFDK